MSFGVNFDAAAWGKEISGMAGDVKDAARPAAQAGAQILYDAVKLNVSRLKTHSGKLAAAIYQAYSRDQSVNGLQVYHVSWNARKAPHGHLVEYGHRQPFEVYFSKKRGGWFTRKGVPAKAPKQVAAKPFVRPAAALFPQALDAARDRFFEELQKKGVVQ